MWRMWRGYCDELIRLASDQKGIWKNLCNFLFEKVSLKEVLLLESIYVDIYNNRSSEMSYFPDETTFLDLS